MFQQDENLPCLHFSLASLVFHEGTKPVNTVRLELPIFEALNMKRDLSDDEAKIISIRENSSRYLTLWWKVRKACAQKDPVSDGAWRSIEGVHSVF